MTKFAKGTEAMVAKQQVSSNLRFFSADGCEAISFAFLPERAKRCWKKVKLSYEESETFLPPVAQQRTDGCEAMVAQLRPSCFATFLYRSGCAATTKFL
jgi:hypothetical protein